MARLLHLHSQTDAMTLLKALTLYPSRCLKGVNTGVLEKEGKAMFCLFMEII